MSIKQLLNGDDFEVMGVLGGFFLRLGSLGGVLGRLGARFGGL